METEPRPGLATSGMSWERWEHGRSRLGPDPGVPAGQVAAVPVGHGVQRDAAGPAGGGASHQSVQSGKPYGTAVLSPWPPLGKDTPLTGSVQKPHPIPFLRRNHPAAHPHPRLLSPGDDTLGPRLRTRLKCSNTRPTVRPPAPDPAQRPLSLPASRFHLGIPGH